MQWGVLKTVVWAVPVAASLSFAPPFTQEEWAIMGNARVAEDRVELVHAPNEAGAIWTKDPIEYPEWTLEAVIESKADYQDTPGQAGYALWYTASRPKSVDTSALSHGNSDTWDGLAVMVDSLLENGQGSVRGHLSDGTSRFTDLKDVGVESLSRCNIDFRKASSPIPIRIGHSKDGFVVTVSGQLCFLSTEIALPSGYYFGVTANSDKTKDIFTVKSLTVTPGMHPDLVKILPAQEHAGDAASDANVAGASSGAGNVAGSGAGSGANTYDTTPISSSNAVGTVLTKEELLQILQPTLDRVELMEVKVKQVQSAIDQLTDTLSLSMSQITEARAGSGAAVGENSDLSAIQRDIQNMRTQLAEWRKASVNTAQETPLSSQISHAAPSIWTLVMVLVPVQLVVVLLYHGWLKRKESHEKLL